MTEVAIALGLVLVIEGVLYALFPETMRRMMMMALGLPDSRLRTAGLAAALVGVALVYLVKG